MRWPIPPSSTGSSPSPAATRPGSAWPSFRQGSTSPSPHVWRRRKEPLRSCTGSIMLITRLPARKRRNSAPIARFPSWQRTRNRRCIWRVKSSGISSCRFSCRPGTGFSGISCPTSRARLCRLVDLHGPEDRLPGSRACSRSTLMWIPSTGMAREAWPIRAEIVARLAAAVERRVAGAADGRADRLPDPPSRP